MNKTNRKALALLGTGHVVTDSSQGAVTIILALLQPIFALSQTQVGLSMLALNLSSSVLQPLFGILSDCVRTVWLIPLGCLLAGVGMGLTGFAPSYKIFLIAVLVSGIGIAAYHPEATKYSRFVSGDRKATGMSLFIVGGSLGCGIGPILVTYFYGLVGLKGTASLLILSSVTAIILLANLKNITATLRVNEVQDTVGKRSVETANQPNIKVILSVVLLILIVIMRSWTHMGLMTFIPQYYVHHLHYSKVFAATLISVFVFSGAAGTLLGGPAGDRWGYKNVVLWSMAAQMLLLYLFVHLRGIWSVVVVALAGFVIISTVAVTVVMCQELLPNNVGLASGLIQGFGMSMGGVGATLLGWIADCWGMPMMFRLMIIFPVIGFILTLLLPNRKELSVDETF